MPSNTNFLKKINQKVDNLERQLVQLRNSVSSRSNLPSAEGKDLMKVELAEDVQRYSAIKIVHNDGGTNKFSRAILYGGAHADNDLESFIPAIAQSPGTAGDHILAKISGKSMVRTIGSSDVYGADTQIKAGDGLKVDSVAGRVELAGADDLKVYISLESQHPNEELIEVKIGAPPVSTSGEANRLYIVDITSLFGGQTYFGDLFDTDANGDLVSVEVDVPVIAIDNTAMVGTLSAGLKYLARRSQNFGTPDNPFYFYHIQPSRFE